MSTKEENGKESKEPDYDEDDQLEEEQEAETGELSEEKKGGIFSIPFIVFLW